MGATSSSRRASTSTSTSSPRILTIPVTLISPSSSSSSSSSTPFSRSSTSICTSSNSSSISPSLTPNGSRTPSIAIPNGKGKKSSPLSHKFSHHMKRLFHRDQPKYEHSEAWYGFEQEEEYPESSQYRQFQSTSRFEHSSSSRVDHSRTRSVTIIPNTSRTKHIQPTTNIMHTSDPSTWLSLEWILASRSATSGLFDAYPYNVFDAYLLRTHPTSRPCLSFLHAEQQFREKWIGFTPYHSSHTSKLNIIMNEATILYQTYLLPIKMMLSSKVITRLEDVGLNSINNHPNQDTNVTPFIHSDMFSQAVTDIMHTLRIGPFHHFIQTPQYQQLAILAHSTFSHVAA